MPYRDPYGGYGPVRQMPFTSFIGGLQAGQEFQQSGMRGQMMKEQLEDAQRLRQGLREYGETRDTESLWKYSPEAAVKFEQQLQQMELAKQQKMLQQLTSGIDLADKYMPYIATLSKTNPEQAQSLWSDMIGKANGLGLKLPPGLEKLTPETFAGVYKTMQDMKTLPAVLGYMGRMGAAEMSAKSRIDAANIHAATAEKTADKPGSMERNYGWFKKEFLKVNPNASDEEILTEFKAYREKEGTGKQYSAAEQERILTDRVTNMAILPGSPVGKRLKKAESEADYQKILDEEKDKLRPIMFPQEAQAAGGRSRFSPGGGRAGAPGAKAKAGFVRPGPYRGKDGKPVYIANEAEYNKVFGK